MSVNLRPLSLGEIFDRTAELYRKHFVLFAGLSGVYAGAVMILALLQLWATMGLVGGSAGVMKSLLLAFFLLIDASVIFVLVGVSMAANNRAVAWVILGEPATILGAYKSILPKTGRYVWLMILVGLRIFLWIILLAIVFAIGGGILAVLGRGAGGAGPIFVGLIAFVSFVAASVLIVYMFIRYSLAVPACVVEDLSAGDSIERSVELTKGSRGRIFVLLLLTMVITIAIVGVTQFPILISAFTHPLQPLSFGTQALQQVLNFFTNALIGPIYTIGLALFYYDQRIRKEGFDIEWMMQAAGLTALPAGAGESLPPAAEGTETAQA